MRLAKAIALAGAFAISAAASASAAPLAPSLERVTNIVQVAGGCGRGWHPNRWGRCVPNRYYGDNRRYWAGPYYRWHSPSDFVANDLNRHQLGWHPWY